ncbi:TPA: hypothetical protein ACH3X1_000600 [Trebouxia sp. C0004]
MPESVYCHACTVTTSSEARYSNAGDRVCPSCESDFVEITEVPAAQTQPVPNARAGRQRPANTAQGGGRNHGFHRHFTTPGGHNVHLHVVTSMGGLPGPLESLLTNAEPADLAALLQNMQGVTLRPFSLPPGVSPADYGPNGGAAFDDLMLQLMEAHEPQASPTSRDTLSALPRRKVKPAGATSEGLSNTPSDQPAACACGEPCSVCHDGMEEGLEVVELPCQHCYHEDCITAWLKDHNTCPVCRKELPVDQELQRQQQQERQQRLQQEVQRQPAGLQSLFGALNPFHLFGGQNGHGAGQPVHTGGTGHDAHAPIQNYTSAPAATEAAVSGPDRLPVGTVERLEGVQTALRELEARLLHQISAIGNGAEMYVDRATLQARLAEVQAQNGRLQDIADNAMEMLQDPSSHSPRDRSRVGEFHDHVQALDALMRHNTAADNHHEGSEDEDDDGADSSHEHDSRSEEDSPPALMPHEAPERAHDDNDDMPSLVTSDDSDGDSLPDLDHSDADSFPQEHYGSGDSLPDLEADHNSHSYGSEASEVYEDAEDSDEYEETDELPALVDFPPPMFPSAVNGGQVVGPNTPLDLDQQAAVDDLSHELDVADALAASVRLVADEAVFGDMLQMPAAEVHHLGARNPPIDISDAQDSAPSHSSLSERRVVQRINSQSTPQNPAGPSQAQPSGLALAAAPISNPAGVILNQRELSQEGINVDLPRTASVKPELDSNDDKQAELHSHPLTTTPSRKRSFTPAEASSSFDVPTLQHASPDGNARLADGGGAEEGQRSGGLLGGLVPGPVQWAARGAGRLMGSLLRRNSSNRR